MIGSPTDVDPRAVSALSGNKNRELVAWVQRQLNRKFQAGLLVDGNPSPALHHAVVDLLGESDGVIGPRTYRTLTLE